MSVDLVQFVQEKVYANFESGNIEAILALMADDVKWTHHGPRELIPFAGEWNGRDGAAQQLMIFVEATEALFVNVKGMFANGDQVIVLINESYKVNATGKSYVTDVAHIWKIQDGKIVQFDELYDSAAIAEAFRA